MKDEDRRRRLVSYFDQKLGGDRARLIRVTGFTKGRVSQLFTPGQPFGERAASALATKLGLSPDFFERDGGALSQDALDLAAAYDRMSPNEKSRLKLLLQAASAEVHSPTPTPPPPTSRPADQPARRTAGVNSALKWAEQIAQWDEWVAAFRESHTTSAPPPDRPHKRDDH